jgi:hypothetical protein
MTDLSQVSTDDLKAYQAGDLKSVSTAGLIAIQSAMKGVTPTPAKPQTSVMDDIKQGAGDLAAGALRGAGSIGATILAPFDAAARGLNGGKPVSVGGYNVLGIDRRTGMDEGLRSMGANPDSMAFKGGKLAAEVAGTAGVGGVLANGARAVGASAPVVDALASGGMSGGANMLTRTASGALNGAASTALVDPEHAGTGALVGGAIPGSVKVAGMAVSALSDYIKSSAYKLMQSAIKPTIAQLRSGEADTAIQTLLSLGISPNKAGVNKLRDLIEQKNADIADAIQNSGATISKQNVLQKLGDVRAKFSNQVSPTSDLGAIDAVGNDFAAHPNIPGNDIPVQQAQEMKQGTYKVLAKKYGQMGSADIEAQKGLARGLKDEIATAVPEVGPLNADESKLISTLNVAERRAFMDLNKNPLGLSTLAKNPMAWAAFMADRSPAFKALAARAVNQVAGASLGAGNALESAMSLPGVRNATQLTFSRAQGTQQ